MSLKNKTNMLDPKTGDINKIHPDKQNYDPSDFVKLIFLQSHRPKRPRRMN